jgi:hypothetical protein
MCLTANNPPLLCMTHTHTHARTHARAQTQTHTLIMSSPLSVRAVFKRAFPRTSAQSFIIIATGSHTCLAYLPCSQTQIDNIHKTGHRACAASTYRLPHLPAHTHVCSHVRMCVHAPVWKTARQACLMKTIKKKRELAVFSSSSSSSSSSTVCSAQNLNEMFGLFIS